MANKKALNPLSDPARRKSSRLEQKRRSGGSSRDVASPPGHEEETGSDHGDPASQQLMDQMNLAAGKASAEPTRRSARSSGLDTTSRSGAPRDKVQGPKPKTRKRGRPSIVAQENDDDDAASPSKKQKSANVGSRMSVPLIAVPSSSGTGLRRRTRAAAPTTSNRDPYANPADDESAPATPPRTSPRAAKKKQTKRQLNKAKKPNASPLKGQGVVNIPTGTAVDLDDGPATPSASRARRTAEGPKTPRQDGDYQPDAEDGSDDAASPSKSQQESTAANDEGLLQKLRKNIGQLMQLHGCTEHWETLLLARSHIQDDIGNCTAESEVGKNAVRALHEAHKLYKREEAVYWSAAVSASAHLMRCIESIKDNVDNKNETSRRGRDLYQCIIPRLVHMLKTVLTRVSPTRESTEDQLGPLLDTLDIIWQTLERARTWYPRPSTLLGSGVLGRTRSEIAMSIKHIQEAYNAHVQRLKDAEDRKRAQRMHEKRRADWQRENKRELEARDRKMQYSREFTKQQMDQIRREKQGPLRDITRHTTERIHDIDDFSDNEQDPAIYQEPSASASSRARPQRPWTNEEIELLLTALQEVFMKENRFSEIHKRYADELGGRNVDEIMRQAAVIKHNMMSTIESLALEERKDWRWVTSIPG